MASPALFSSNQALIRFHETFSNAVVSLEVKSRRTGSLEGLLSRRRNPLGGTAFFINPEGYLLTASSIVEDAGRIELTTADGRTFQAGVVGASPSGGVALLRMVPPPSEPVEWLKLGSSSATPVGARAFTLGNSFGTLEPTGQVALSRGVVSGRYQVHASGRYKGEVLETDAAVNPGAFGGPLLDEKGEVIGVLLEAYSFNRWLGTALPIDQVKALMPLLMSREEPGPGEAGFVCEERVIERIRGRVTRVEKGSAAEKAGLRTGDEIVEFGGCEIDSYTSFSSALYRLPAGSVVNLRVIRARNPLVPEEKMVRLTFEVGPPRESLPAADRGTLGIRVAGDKGAPGVKVTWVAEDGAAGRAGIRPGDVFRLIEGKSANPGLVKGILGSKRIGGTVRLRVSRDGWEKDFRLRIRPLRRL